MTAGAFVVFDFAVAQPNHAVGVQRDVRLVGDENDGVAFLVQVGEERHDFVAGGGIEISGGLIGEQDRRMIHERARNGHALPLAAGKLVGLVHHARRRESTCARTCLARSKRSSAGVPL